MTTWENFAEHCFWPCWRHLAEVGLARPFTIVGESSNKKFTIVLE